MSYDYEKEKQATFTEAGQRLFLSIRDRVKLGLKRDGAIMMAAATEKQSGNSWEMLACVDRMVEIGELYELTYAHGRPQGQHRVFVHGDFGPRQKP